MSEAKLLASALLIGSGATLVMDLWTILRKRWFGVPALDYAMVGRWVLYLLRGQYFHRPIAASPALPGERAVGWIAHYLTGIAFAAVLLGLWHGWAGQPTLAPALIVGLASVAAPFLIMQPAMGAGIAARRTPRPAVARFHSLVTHGIFGAGLYVAGWSLHQSGLLP